jgi:hypothetical protein
MFQKLALIGIGLIGSSIARAARAKGLALESTMPTLQVAKQITRRAPHPPMWSVSGHTPQGTILKHVTYRTIALVPLQMRWHEVGARIRLPLGAIPIPTAIVEQLWPDLLTPSMRWLHRTPIELAIAAALTDEPLVPILARAIAHAIEKQQGIQHFHTKPY